MTRLALRVGALLLAMVGGWSGCGDDSDPPSDGGAGMAGGTGGASGDASGGMGGAGGTGGSGQPDAFVPIDDAGPDADAQSEDGDGGATEPPYYGVCGIKRWRGYDRTCDGTLDTTCGL